MKIPKKIPICGRPYKVKVDPTHDGGSLSEADQLIVIGTVDPKKVPDIFLHEVWEATVAIRNFRYVLQRAEPDNGDYLFCMNHAQYEQVISDVANSLSGVSFPRLGK